MKKLFTLCLFIPVLAWSQLTIKIDYAYNLTPLADDLFLAGTFNSWSENNSAYKFTRTGFNIFEITINPAPGLLEYKITRGAWVSVESDAQGANIANRTYTYSGAPATINIQINGWEDIGGNGHTTASSNVHILDTDFPIPQLNRTRKIWIYLPPDYHTSQKEYPVLYMQDGQNLFDQYSSAYGEWEIDESLNTLFNQGDYGIIIVGIDNGGATRMDEYSPWINSSYGGGEGDEYIDWMANDLKPYIDGIFRTLAQPENTGIMGSSMGGLISQYGAVKYPQTFKKAGILSPSFWFSDSIFSQVRIQGIQPDMKFYFVSGTTESTTMAPQMMDMRDSLINEGLNASRIDLLTFADGQHSEWFWAREFPAAYQWLFSDLNVSTHTNNPITAKDAVFEIFPNPAADKIFIHFENNNAVWNIELLNVNGEILFHQEIKNDEILDTKNLPNGIYLLKGISSKGDAAAKKFVIQQ